MVGIELQQLLTSKPVAALLCSNICTIMRVPQQTSVQPPRQFSPSSLSSLRNRIACEDGAGSEMNTQ